MNKIQSCGFLIYREEPTLSFLLMQHPTRWDLPKGHVDPGETEMQCALRELAEETGITDDLLEIDDGFRFDQQYMVSLKKYNHEPRPKNLTIFLAKLNKPNFEIQPTEHDDYRWMDWDPPHDIQAKTINPLLDAIADFWTPIV